MPGSPVLGSVLPRRCNRRSHHTFAPQHRTQSVCTSFFPRGRFGRGMKLRPGTLRSTCYRTSVRSQTSLHPLVRVIERGGQRYSRIRLLCSGDHDTSLRFAFVAYRDESSTANVQFDYWCYLQPSTLLPPVAILGTGWKTYRGSSTKGLSSNQSSSRLANNGLWNTVSSVEGVVVRCIGC